MSHEAIALWTEASSDPELIAGVRAGDTAAFGVLYERHVDAARKVASMYSNSPTDVEDVVSESFSRVLRALQRGDGPDLAFRAYLFTIVRRTGMDVINKGNRTRPRDDMETFETGLGYETGADEPTLDGFEHGMVADAFRSLPERWQAVLWYTEVEKKSPREIAPLLGLSANGVAALSYRAREALRQAYLQQHLNGSEEVSCLEANAQLGAYVRGGLNKRESARLTEHVRGCERCSALVAELEDVNRGMRGVIAPFVLGAVGVSALDGGLAIGGVLGGAKVAGTAAGASAQGAGAGTAGTAAGGSGAAGGASIGATISQGVGAALSAAASFAVPIVATVAAVALGVAGAGYLGLLSGDPAPIVVAHTSPSPTPDTDATAEPAPDAVAPEPVVTPSPEPTEPESASPPSGTNRPAPHAGTTPQTGDPDPGPNPPTEDPGDEPGETPGEEPGETPGEDPGEKPGPGNKGEGAVLAIAASPLGVLEIARSTPEVPLAVTNSGDEDSAEVAALITLPAGLEFAAPEAGSGQNSRHADRLSAYMNFVLFGIVEVGDWECSFDETMTVATCDIESIAAGVASEVAIPAAVTLEASEQLAEDATIDYVLRSGDIEVTYSVPAVLASSEEHYEQPFTGQGRLAAAHFGAPLMGCLATQSVNGTTCEQAMAFSGNGSEGKYNNNAWVMVPLNEADGERNSASTQVSLPQGAVVKYAAIEWASNRGAADAGFDGPLDAARIRVPGGEYVDLVADTVTTTLDVSHRINYQARAEITSLVAQAGAGAYSVADIAQSIDLTENGGGDPNYFAGFAITIVYELETLPESTVVFFDGSEWASATTTPDFTFHTDGPARVTLGFVAWDGDRGSVGDQAQIGNLNGNGQALKPLGWNGVAQTNAGDTGNAASSTAFGSRYANTLGVDAKLFEPANVGKGLHVLRFSGNGDNYLLGTFTVTITPNN